MFASLIFVFEKEEKETTFHTMFDSYWWAIITMTTVTGYFRSFSQNILRNIPLIVASLFLKEMPFFSARLNLPKSYLCTITNDEAGLKVATILVEQRAC